MKWKDLLKYPPRYFYDAHTRTLGLDGYWSGWYKKQCGARTVEIQFETGDDIFYHGEGPLTIYIGDHFHRHPNFGFVTPLLFSESYVTVSPKNKDYYSVDGILFSKKDNKPALEIAGEGLYKIVRNGKWGAINKKLEVVIPTRYDYVCHSDKNGLFLVRHDEGSIMKFGMVDKNGVELLPAIFEIINLNEDGTYTLEKGCEQYTIDKNGQRIMKKEHN